MSWELRTNMSKFKLLVASCMPDPEGLSREPVHYVAGTVLPLSDEDGARAVAQGAAVPFDSSKGGPECEKQGRPCTIECWRGAGGEDEDYFPSMVEHEDRKREAAFRARSDAPQEPVASVPDLPVDPVLPEFPPSDATTVDVVPDHPADPVLPPHTSRRPASQ